MSNGRKAVLVRCVTVQVWLLGDQWWCPTLVRDFLLFRVSGLTAVEQVEMIIACVMLMFNTGKAVLLFSCRLLETLLILTCQLL